MVITGSDTTGIIVMTDAVMLTLVTVPVTDVPIKSAIPLADIMPMSIGIPTIIRLVVRPLAIRTSAISTNESKQVDAAKKTGLAEKNTITALIEEDKYLDIDSATKLI